jgi:hypothetical protein
MASSIRGIHISPGVYSKETDITYAIKSLGITTLGVVGETQKGPAFQPMAISNWREFVEMFGGTNPEKFKGSQYPKYELPYIAKSYLTQSNQLEVVRVLGLSGYNAGPAWVVTASNEDSESYSAQKRVVAVLRPRGHYYKYRKFDASTGTCACPNESYDTLVYDVGECTRNASDCNKSVKYNEHALKLESYTPLYSSGNECDNYEFLSKTTDFNVSGTNYGRFKIKGIRGVHNYTDTYETIKSGETSGDCFEYAVSLNSADKDYIVNVLGTDPSNGDAPIYVEALYDVSLGQAIASQKEDEHITKINKKLTFYQVYYPTNYDSLEPVAGLLTIQETNLSRKNIGQRFLADRAANANNDYVGDLTIMSHIYDYKTNEPIKYEDISAHTSAYSADTEVFGGISGDSISSMTSADSGCYKGEIAGIFKEDGTGFAITPVKVGFIYTVVQYTDGNGKRHYYYRTYSRTKLNEKLSSTTESNSGVINTATSVLYDNLQYPGTINEAGSGYTRVANLAQVCVKNLSDGLYYRIITQDSGDTYSDVHYVDCDMNNYKSAYRYASTPWIVSNLMGDYNHIELKRLFRFHTISDGDASNSEVKISIENIKPDEGTFDVVIRDINDTDEYQVVLEKFSKCNLSVGSKNYIAYKIGSYDGSYESKSKYVTVECKEGEMTPFTVPAGFLGYPQIKYDGYPILDNNQSNIINLLFKYNRSYDVDVKNRKQYFGLSTRVGVDLDMFTYKGRSAYIDKPDMLTHGFHLDSRLDLYSNDYTSSTNSKGYNPTVTVDGEVGYKFDAVSRNSRTTTLTNAPIIGAEEAMQGTIYEYVNLRKFTLYFYGGFDGWDKFREARTNTDDFKMSKYLGTYDFNSGEGYAFDRIEDTESLGLNQVGITSDWYAYLAGIRQFANPEAVDINVFATPGIDYVNNTSLVEEAIEMIEEERADSIYVVTTPDKPYGAGDFVDEMYTPDDAVFNLEDTEINSNYTCTYYPWVKYLDEDNHQYIYLPPTKDAVRDMAQTDNTAYPWFAPAGLERGDVDCVKAHFITKLADEDTLYEGRINPIKTFAADGVHIWGQKNLQVAESQLNRIAVRRLLLRMRKLIAIACRNLIFEPNDKTTKNSFLSIVTPIMDNIKSNRGISDYQIEVDDTVEARERRELPARIFFKPYNSLEYILLDFVVTPEGMSFSDI